MSVEVALSEVTGRFVGKNDFGLVDQRSGNSHPLTLAAGHCFVVYAKGDDPDQPAVTAPWRAASAAPD